MLQLFAADFRRRPAQCRRDRPGHPGRPGGRRQLAGLEGRQSMPPRHPDRRAHAARRDEQRGRPGGPAALWRGRFFAPGLRPVSALPECSDRGREHPPLADVGVASAALHQRHRARRGHFFAWRQQRRLRSGKLPRCADRKMPVRHRRRLHRHQVRPQQRRPARRACRP